MQNNKKGFTLIELAVTFAVIGVLLSISIPSAVSYYRNYKQIERNEIAQAIYVAVQNQLIRLEGWGNLNQVDSSLKEVVGDDYKTARFVQDISTTSSGDFYYVGSEDQKVIDLIYPGNNNNDFIANGDYVIECDPDKGVVYGVFFSELDLFSSDFYLYKEASSIGYRDNNEARKDLRVGYYCGGKDFVKPIPSSSGGLNAQVQLKNEEELYLSVKLDQMGSIVINPDKLKLELAFPLPNSSGSITYEIENWVENKSDLGGLLNNNSEGYFRNSGSEYEFIVILDSLEDKLSFAKQFQGKFTPGQNINAKVILELKDDKGLVVSQSLKYETASVNSLFATIDGGTIQVANGRHLQNLTSTQYVNGINKVSLTKTLDWEDTQKYYKGNYPTLYNGSNELKLSSIDNNALFSDNTLEVNGNGNSINNLAITNKKLGLNNEYFSQAGLFSNISSNIKNLTLNSSGMEITSDQDLEAVGILAGKASGNITSCGVVNTKIIASTGSKVNIGGLLGTNSGGTISNCYVRGNNAYSDVTLQNKKGDIAGFVYQNTGTITMSYVAGTVTSEQGQAAGFAAVNSGSITKCYANAKTTGDTAAVGFVLTNEDTINNCYALVDVQVNDPTKTAYGFVSANNAEIKDCYSATKEDLKFAPDTISTCFTLAGDGADKLKTHFTTEPLKNNWNTTVSNEITFPYTPETGLLSTAPYPYPALKNLPCYGNWPEVLVTQGELMVVYYEIFNEVYVNGSNFANRKNYVFYGKDANEEELINTLGLVTNNLGIRPTVVKDGYAVLVKNGFGNVDGSAITLTYSGLDSVSTTNVISDDNTAVYHVGDKVSLDGSKLKVKATDDEYYLYLLPNSWLQNTIYTNQTLKVADKSKEFTMPCDPHFAYTNNTEDNQNVIRTPRHFYNLANYTAYQSKDYYQEMDLDYQNYNQGNGKYGTDFTQQISITNFSGIYSGNNHVIYHSPIVNENTKNGLFASISGTVQDLNWKFDSLENIASNINAFLVGTNSGTMKNLTLEFGAKVTSVNEGNKIQGIMVNENQDTISNCQIKLSDDLILQNSSSAVGTFVGSNSGTIENSFVQLLKSGANIIATGSNFGGFCGTNSGTLDLCCFKTDGATIKGNGTTKTGGFIGTNNATGKIDGCYVWDTSGYNLRLESNVINAGFAVGNLGTIENSRVVGASVYCKDGSVAGFVNDNTGTINKSYTNSIVLGNFAAGFVRNNYQENGRVGSINFCYSLINVETTDKANGKAAGFAIRNNDGNISYCYTAASPKNNITPFCNSNVKVTECYYLKSAKTTATTTTSSGIFGEGLIYVDLKNAFAEGTWHLSSSGNAQPYDPALGDYPFPSLASPLLEGTSVTKKINHYGDWNKSLPNSIGIYYYEIYDNDSMGIYLTGYEMNDSNKSYTATLSNLSNELTIKEASYGVYLFSEEDTFKDFKINDSDVKIPDNKISYGYDGYIFFNYYNSTEDNNSAMRQLDQASDTITLTNDDNSKTYGSFKFNTHFAKAIRATDQSFTWGKDESALIRTAEQFDNINEDDRYLTDYSFKQDRNLDMSVNLNQNPYLSSQKYTAYTSFRNIGGGTNTSPLPFNSKYDGQNYSIDNLKIDFSSCPSIDKDYVGLFSNIGPRGELRNLMVRGSASDKYGINFNLPSGDTDNFYIGLVARNDGLISNVHTNSDFKVMFNYNVGLGNTLKINMGGLVGENYGTITSSGAKGEVIAEAGGMTNSNTIYSGGLIGYNDTSGLDNSKKKSFSDDIAINIDTTVFPSFPGINNYPYPRSSVYYNYATGNVKVNDGSANLAVSSFIGYNDSKVSGAGSAIVHCYARGQVSLNNKSMFLGKNMSDFGYGTGSQCWFCYAYNNGYDDPDDPSNFVGNQTVVSQAKYSGGHPGSFMYGSGTALNNIMKREDMSNIDNFIYVSSSFCVINGNKMYFLLFTPDSYTNLSEYIKANCIRPKENVWTMGTVDGVTLPRLINNNEADYN